MVSFFFQIEALLSMKNAWLPPIVWIRKARAKFYFLRIVLNRAKQLTAKLNCQR